MTATEYCFPRFLPGQVLTDDDLNDLREDYARRVMNLGTLVGFGVGCGLDARLEGATLFIDPGYAVDQEGRFLVLREEQRIDVSSVTGADTSFPFVEAAEDGFTVVLRAREDVQPAPGPCSDPACDTHAETVCERVEIVFVDGRLRVTDDIERDVLALQPLRISDGDKVDGSIATLRDALVDALEGHIDPNALGALADVGGRTSTGALAVQRATLLNTVLVLTWELYRCLVWMRLACFRDDRPAGVALGHLGGSASSRTWACEWRHHFELSAAIARGILGSRCEDPCRRFRVYLETVITGYREIEIPAPGDPPRDGDPPIVDVCRPKRVGNVWIYPCDWIELPPPLVIEPDWYKPPLVWPPVPLPEPWPPWRIDDWWTDPNPLDSWILPADPTHSGVINVRDLLGRDGEAVQPRVVDALGAEGITTPVDVLPLAEAKALEGYRASPVVVGSDRIVIAVDAEGKTVETGSIPTTLGLRGAGPNASLARTEASTARTDAAVARDEALAATQGVAGLENRVEILSGDIETTVAGLGQLEGQIDERFEAIMPALQAQISEALGLAQTEFFSEVRRDIEGAISEVTTGLQVELGGLRGDLEVLQGDLGGFREELGGLREEIGGFHDEFRRIDRSVTERVDRIVAGFSTGRSPAAVERTAAANEALYDSLRSLREAATAVREDLAPRARERFDEQLASVDENLAVVEAAVRSDRPVLESEGVAVVEATDALGRALRAAGLTGAPRREMEASLRRLGEAIHRR